jgi:hypothetical protein
MEPTHTLPVPTATAAWGELVVKNGRLAGARHPLDAAFILIGRSATCDMRLHAASVRPLHAALVLTADGPTLRELQGSGGTTLNGGSVAGEILRDGDEIAFGPFEFRIELTASPARSRIAPPKRRAGRTPQESEATEDTRQRLIEARNQAHDAQAALRQERARQQKESTEAAVALSALKKEVEDGRGQLQTERRRLFNLRLRLRQRLHRHWMSERATMRKREEALAADRRTLEKECERLQAERQELYRARLHQNGEAELGKRQLRDSENKLRQEQERLQQQRTREQAELAARLRDIESREICLGDAERKLAEDRRRGEALRLQLEKEVEGLDVRVRNQRRKLLVQEEALRRRQQEARQSSGAEVAADAAPVAAADGPPLSADTPESKAEPEDARLQPRVAELDRLASDLADQRLYLAEQCERLHTARKQWQQERAAATAGLESLAVQLDEREQSLREREQARAAIDAGHEQARQELAQQRRFLDTWQARIAVRVALWEGERDRLLAEMRTREEKAEMHLAALGELRRRAQERRTQESERAQTLIAACEQLRGECTTLRDDWLQRGTALEKERRALAERALAIEEYRFRFLQRTDNPALVEQRLLRLRDRWASEFEAALQPVVRERQELAADWNRLQEGIAKLREDLTALTTRETDLARRQAEHEQQNTRNNVEQKALRAELERHRSQRAIYDRQLAALNEEVERLARAMLDESEGEAARPRAA